jgi:hypothetical protein
VKSKSGQCVVAFLVALAEMCFRLAQNVDAPYFALTVVGPIAMMIEIWRTSRAAAGSVKVATSAGS